MSGLALLRADISAIVISWVGTFSLYRLAALQTVMCVLVLLVYEVASYLAYIYHA